LPFLNEDGEMQVVVPARFAFSSGRFAALRSWILKNYAVKSVFALPPGTFSPYTGIKTYLFTFSTRPVEKVAIGLVQKEEEMYLPEIRREISPKELLAREDWPVELFLMGPISKFIPESYPKVKLKEVAEVFRGKSIVKKKDSEGNVALLNISNIDNGEILWDSVEKIDEDDHKIEKYELQVGDVVLTCRGTVNKVAVVRELPMKVIPSANLIVIRLHSKFLSDYLKIFLESPVGEKLIQSFQRGTTVMNINPRDLGELEIPLKDLDEQERLVQEYRKEQEMYLKTIQEVSQRWQKKRESIYKQIFAE
jgi:type I restriction-modification system DNA methylase subunit